MSGHRTEEVKKVLRLRDGQENRDPLPVPSIRLFPLSSARLPASNAKQTEPSPRKKEEKWQKQEKSGGDGSECSGRHQQQVQQRRRLLAGRPGPAVFL